jgi:hypothetical protein
MLLHPLVRSCFSATKLCMTGLLFSLLLTNFAPTAQARPLSAQPVVVKSASSLNSVATNRQSLANGTYMYGETSSPGESGREYMVFDNQDGMVVGAVFLANSEYSCFAGQVRPRQLDMIIADSYSDVTRPYSVTIESTPGETITGAEYRSVAQISSGEMTLLQSCRKFYRNRLTSKTISG